MKKEKQEKQPAEKKQESVSAFKNAREIQAEEQRKAEQRERERQAKSEEDAYRKREEYAKTLAEDKVELLRLKQGMTEDSEKVFPEQEPEKHYTVWQKIGNWFYHAKWWLGAALFCAGLVAFLAYDYFSEENPDLSLLILCDQGELMAHTEQMNDWIESFCADYNEDEEHIVKCIYIPVSEKNLEQGTAAQTYETQLLMQFQSSGAMLVLTDKEAEPCLQADEAFVDLTELYPGHKEVDGYRLYVGESRLGEILGTEEPLRKDTYFALRVPRENLESLEKAQTVYNQAKETLDILLPMIYEDWEEEPHE